MKQPLTATHTHDHTRPHRTDTKSKASTCMHTTNGTSWVPVNVNYNIGHRHPFYFGDLAWNSQFHRPQFHRHWQSHEKAKIPCGKISQTNENTFLAQRQHSHHFRTKIENSTGWNRTSASTQSIWISSFFWKFIVTNVLAIRLASEWRNRKDIQFHCVRSSPFGEKSIQDEDSSQMGFVEHTLYGRQSYNWTMYVWIFRDAHSFISDVQWFLRHFYAN